MRFFDTASAIIGEAEEDGEVSDPPADPDPPAEDERLAVTVQGASLTDDAGESWDWFGGYPDPYAHVALAGFEKSTPCVSDTYLPSWGFSVAVVYASDLVSQELVAAVYVYDFLEGGGGTKMGECSVLLHDEPIEAGTALVLRAGAGDCSGSIASLTLDFAPAN